MAGPRSAPHLHHALVAVCLLAAHFAPAHARLVELKHFDEALQREGVGLAYSDEGLARLIDLVRHEVDGIEQKAAAASGDERAHLKLLASAVDQALAKMITVQSSPDEDAKAAAFPELKSLLYSVRSDLQGRRRGGMIAI